LLSVVFGYDRLQPDFLGLDLGLDFA